MFRRNFNSSNGEFDSHPPRQSREEMFRDLDLNWRLRMCRCPPGLFRFEWTGNPPEVGAYCPACLLVTLRDEAEVDRFIALYEHDTGMKAAVAWSLLRQLRDRYEELNAGLEAPRSSREMEVIPFD